MTDDPTFWISLIGTLCWPICFWWMRRISARQDAVLQALRKQAGRIERVSKEEHDLIQEVHPAVEGISQGIEEIKEAERHAGGSG